MRPAAETAAEPRRDARRPEWARWAGEHEVGPYSLGVEEEVMLLEPGSWDPAYRVDDVLAALPDGVATKVSAETHGSAVELQSGVHATVAEAVGELRELRVALAETLTGLGMRPACAGTHPLAVWHEVAVSSGERYQEVYESMRELARREPTFALHVHVGIPEPEEAIRVANRLRVHLGALLALSANSPFWQGRDTGLASARTPVFQAFPRVGVPRAFASYGHYVEAVDLLIRCGAVAEPTFLWWDVRPQPSLGTVEVRVMDAQTQLWQTEALVALVQSLCRLEAEQGYASDAAMAADEVLAENRFLASRDGIEAHLIDVDRERRVPAADSLVELIGACTPHAGALRCEAELAAARKLARRNGASGQLAAQRRLRSLPRVIESLADEFCS